MDDILSIICFRRGSIIGKNIKQCLVSVETCIKYNDLNNLAGLKFDANFAVLVAIIYEKSDIIRYIIRTQKITGYAPVLRYVCKKYDLSIINELLVKIDLSELQYNMIFGAVVKNNNVELVKKLLPKIDCMTYSETFRSVLETENVELIKIMFTSPYANWFCNCNLSAIKLSIVIKNTELFKIAFEKAIYDCINLWHYAIEQTAYKGSLNMFKFLIKYKGFNNEYCDTNRMYQSILISSVNGDNIKITKFMMNYLNIDLAYNLNMFFRRICELGIVSLVRVSLRNPKINPADVDNHAIKTASANGHYGVVYLLLKDRRVNPLAENNKAYNLAIENKFDTVAELLCSDNRIANYLLSRQTMNNKKMDISY
jgi:hypothetical protein